MEFPNRVYAVMRPDGCIVVPEMKDFADDSAVVLQEGEEIAVYALEAIGKIRLGPAVTFPGNEAEPKAVKRGRPKGAKTLPKPAPEPEAA